MERNENKRLIFCFDADADTARMTVRKKKENLNVLRHLHYLSFLFLFLNTVNPNIIFRLPVSTLLGSDMKKDTNYLPIRNLVP